MQPPDDVGLDWLNRDFISMMGVMMIALIGRTLMGSDPINVRRLIGESLLMIVGAVAMYVSGVLAELNGLQMLLIACTSSLGTVRGCEWIVRVVVAVYKVAKP